MDLSIYGYLNRMSTEKLLDALFLYSQPTMLKDYGYAVKMMIEILTKRGVEIPREILDRIGKT